MATNIPLDSSKPPRVYPKLNRRLRIAMWLAFLGGPAMIAMGGYQYFQSSKLETEGVKVMSAIQKIQQAKSMTNNPEKIRLLTEVLDKFERGEKFQ